MLYISIKALVHLCTAAVLLTFFLIWRKAVELWCATVTSTVCLIRRLTHGDQTERALLLCSRHLQEYMRCSTISSQQI